MTLVDGFLRVALVAAILLVLAALFALVTEAGAATISRLTMVQAIERMFNATPGMVMSRDIPGVGNRLMTYKRVEIRPGDEYAVIISVRKW